MIKIQGKAALEFKVKQAQEMLKEKFTNIIRKQVKNIFVDLVQGTPQYTGNLASNWYIQLNTKPGYHPIPTYTNSGWRLSNPYQMGDDPAVSNTLMRELVKLEDLNVLMFKGGLNKITITNTAPYASEVEQGQTPHKSLIRSVNIKGGAYGDIVMKEYILLKYSHLKYRG